MSYCNYYPNSSIFHAYMRGSMGTQLDLLLIGDDKEKLGIVWERIEKEVVRLNKLMSKFDVESEVYRINRLASKEPIKIDKELYNIISDCVKYNQITDGYFDITLGKAKNLILDDSKQSISFSIDDIEVDLGGYGKGYALKKIKEIIDNEKIENALVNFGNSSILAIGSHPSGDCWKIAVVDPYNGQPLYTYHLRNSSLTISGNMPTHPKHIVDPHTGLYDERRRISSVNTLDPTIGEVYSTAAMLMNDQQIESLNRKIDIIEQKTINIEL